MFFFQKISPPAPVEPAAAHALFELVVRKYDVPPCVFLVFDVSCGVIVWQIRPRLQFGFLFLDKDVSCVRIVELL